MAGRIPLRDPVPAGAEDAIKGAASDAQIIPVVRSNDPLNQRIKRRIGDAGQVLRTFDVGGLRGEKRTERVPRRRRHAEPLDSNIEIEIIDASPELYRIDKPHIGINAKHAQVLDVGRVMGLERRFVEQKFHPNCVPFGNRRLPSLITHPASCKSWDALRKKRPVLARSIGDRRQVWITKHVVGHLAAKWLKQLELFRRWFARRHQVRVLEWGVRARVGAVHNRLVGPLEIEGLSQRVADTRILELLASCIEEPALRA